MLDLQKFSMWWTHCRYTFYNKNSLFTSRFRTDFANWANSCFCTFVGIINFKTRSICIGIHVRFKAVGRR